MATRNTTPATREYCVWADCNRRVYQKVAASSPEEAFRIAREHPEGWQFCFEHEDNGYRLSDEVQDTASGEFIRVGARARHCKTCGSEIVETVNDSLFRDGECNGCEYERYRSQPELRELVQAYRQECADQIQQHRDDLKEDYGDPDDLQEMIDYWKQCRDRCDAALAKAYGKAS